MSSSKIQERNLDPNMGLAKESSVQEIKSSMAKESSLTEILNQTNDTNLKVSELANRQSDDSLYIFTPSSTVLKTIISKEIGTNGEGTTAILGEPLYISRDGTIRVNATVKSSSTGYGSGVQINLYRRIHDNDLTYEKTTAFSVDYAKGDTKYHTTYTDLIVKKGDVLDFYMYVGDKYHNIYCKLLTISGDVIMQPNYI